MSAISTNLAHRSASDSGFGGGSSYTHARATSPGGAKGESDFGDGAQFCAHHQTLRAITKCSRGARSPLFTHTWTQFVARSRSPCKWLIPHAMITYKQEVAGSSPALPTHSSRLQYDEGGNVCPRAGNDRVSGVVVQLVRTLPCHGRGRGFESRRPRHHSKELME